MSEERREWMGLVADLRERLAAAEAAIGIAEQQLTVICDGVNRRCGFDRNQLPLVSLDRLLAAHERDLTECRRLLREYGGHKANCGCCPGACDCGWDEAAKAVGGA